MDEKLNVSPHSSNAVLPAALLIPRFKLIADYPGNSQPIGSVFIENANAVYFRKFKSNFKELEWWEDRNVENMPDYIKHNFTGEVKYIEEHFCYISGGVKYNSPVVCHVGSGDFWRYDCCSPSSRKEFITKNRLSEG
jgi:hypothetical protein